MRLPFRLRAAETTSQRAGLMQCLLLLALAVAVPLIILVSIEVWTATLYTRGLGVTEFVQQYSTGVYRYRVIGKELVLAVYRMLAMHLPETTLALPHDPAASSLLCMALALVNGACLFVANLLLLGLLWVRRRGLGDIELAAYLFYTLLLTLSLVVVTPYDQMAYLLLLMGMLGARSRSWWLSVAVVAVSAVVGVLTRETEFLMPAWLATLVIVSPDALAMRYRRLFWVSLVCCIATYAGLRVWMTGHPDVVLGVTVGGKWSVESLAVLVLLLCVTAALALRMRANLRPMMMMMAFSTPYLATILLGGTLRELRLTVPVVLCILLLYVQLVRDEEHLMATQAVPRDTIMVHA